MPNRALSAKTLVKHPPPITVAIALLFLPLIIPVAHVPRPPVHNDRLMSATGADDDHVAFMDSPVNPISPSSDESSDVNMQEDSDVDLGHQPDVDADADADGDLEEASDSDVDQLTPQTSLHQVASSSYLNKRAVRPPLCPFTPLPDIDGYMRP